MKLPSNILVVLPNNLGDTIMATPVLEGLKFKYPNVRILYLVEKGFEDALLGNIHIDNLYCFDRAKIRNLMQNDKWEEGSLALLQTINQIKEFDCDFFINLSQQDYLATLLPLLDIPPFCGYWFLRDGNDAIVGDWTTYLYAIPFARKYNAFHAVDIYRRMARVKNHHGTYTININKNEKDDAVKYLEKTGVDISSSKIIVFQPGAAFQSKRWPVEHWVALGKRLVASGWQILISGALSERSLARQIKKGVGGNCFVIAGNTTFREAIAILSCVNVCVTGDTALMHAAAGQNVKVYALFGSTNPVETGPYGNNHIVFSGSCTSMPCFKRDCSSMECMKSISHETVFAAIEKGIFEDNKTCSIYQTKLKESSDFSLVPITKRAWSYYSEAGAYLTHKAFEPHSKNIITDNHELESCQLENKKTIAILYKLEQMKDYLDDRDIGHIKKYENGKAELSHLSGIAQFWTAVLNLRLNSIPMLDPIAGLKESLLVCNRTRKQIQSVLSFD